MEIRELKYFLAVAREQSISKAARELFVTQPNLSRQMQNLEKEMGRQLFVRGNRKIVLTEAGELLRKRASEILELCEKTESELTSPISDVSGDVCIGGGESYVMKIIANVICSIQNQFPSVKFHIFSGDSFTVAEKLDKGLIDFGVFIEPFDASKYESIKLPLCDEWGIIMRKDSPLAQKEYVTPQDLWDKPIIRSQQSLNKTIVGDWFKKSEEELNIVATYNLIYNASLLVEAGVGYAVSLDKLLNTSGESNLCFRPLYPKLHSHLVIAWKKYQIFSKAAELFLRRLQECLSQDNF